MGCCELFALHTRLDHDVIDSKHRDKLDPSAIAFRLLQQIERLKDGHDCEEQTLFIGLGEEKTATVRDRACSHSCVIAQWTVK